MRTTNMQIFAVTVLSLANVWLFWMETRWLMYYPPVVKVIPGASLYGGIVPVLEVPGAIVLIVAGYFLAYRSTFALWRYRFVHYRTEMLTNAMIINSILLVTLTGLGIAEWLNFYHSLPIDLFAVVGVGLAAASVSIYIEKQPRWPRPLPFADFERVGSIRTGWRKYIERREGW